MSILKPGQTVVLKSSGLNCKIEDFLGGGGQGEVYRANLNGKPVAVKWYYPATGTPEQESAIEVLVRKGPPNDKFLWPMELASSKEAPKFGYIMPLREPRYKNIVDLMKRRIEPSFRSLCTIGYELADSYLQLHSRGLCYRDISFGNAFFEPNTGGVLICDNDNVAVDTQTKKGGVYGTPRFMAPEIVCGKAAPSTQTDLYSLAVLLFYIFIIHHPLEGEKEASIKCMDLPAMNKLYGFEPVFIYDPNNDTNRPVRGFHDNALDCWPIFPKFLRDRFTQAFTKGIKDPVNGRVRESEWRSDMIHLRDSIFYCPFCGAENFFDEETTKVLNGVPGPCWSCQKQPKLPARIQIGKNTIMLNHDTQLFPHHIDGNRLYDFSKPIAELSQHPTNPNIWGLKNISSQKWVITSKDGGVKDVEPGKTVPLAVGTKIQFGTAEGEILF